MSKILGVYRDKNRLQVWLSVFLFTLFSWQSLNPKDFHILDGMHFIIAFPMRYFCHLKFPFRVNSGFTELLFLLLITLLPIIMYSYFKRHNAKYMASIMFFWFAYVCQDWFRFFDIIIYQSIALIAYGFCLIFLFMGLLNSLKYSENIKQNDSVSFADNFNNHESETEE